MSTDLSPQEVTKAAQEILARRELAHDHLIPFITSFNPKYEAGWVHKDICHRLEQFEKDVSAGKSPRLMLFMPPRHGKSEIASRNFPAWYLGRNPDHEIIATSYASSLAQKFSRAARDTVESPEYQHIFPTRLNQEARNLDNWLTSEGGGYMAAGVGGGITGNGMHVGIIDDPVKNDEEAQSETTRQSHKDWYNSVFYTRLAPKSGILIIMTRWHDDDLAGWLLSEQQHGGDEWDVIVYPAVATEDEQFRRKGEALHPERYPIEALNQRKRVLMSSTPRHWYALYQQTPVSDEGEYFQRKNMRFYDPQDVPPIAELTRYTAWDLAIGQKNHNDWSVGLTVGVDRADRIWVLDIRRGRWDGYELVEEILDTFETWRSSVTGIERGQIEMALGPFLDKRIQERKLYDFYYEGLKPGRNDKMARARPIQGRMKQGMVLFPKGAPWMEQLLYELLRFPNGVYDDQVDALAWIGQMLQLFYTQPEIVEHIPSWRDKLGKHMQGNTSPSSAMSA